MLKSLNWQDLSDRFWAKVQKTDGCWLWTAATDENGYGRFNIAGVSQLAHRVAWFFYYGVWPTKFVCHSCDTPGCVRRECLFEGTQVDNMRDASRKGRIRGTFKEKEQCVHGHPFNDENTGWYFETRSGKRRRYCLACSRIINRNLKRYKHQWYLQHRNRIT